ETRRQAPRSEAKPRQRPADGSGALPSGSLDGTNKPHRHGGHPIRRICGLWYAHRAELMSLSAEFDGVLTCDTDTVRRRGAVTSTQEEVCGHRSLALDVDRAPL